jgi:hypothetical protein
MTSCRYDVCYRCLNILRLIGPSVLAPVTTFACPPQAALFTLISTVLYICPCVLAIPIHCCCHRGGVGISIGAHARVAALHICYPIPDTCCVQYRHTTMLLLPLLLLQLLRLLA